MKHKGLTRPKRLPLGKSWLERYQGKKPIRDYRKYFDVPSDCAVQELQMLGLALTKEEIAKGRNGEKARARNRKAKEQKAAAKRRSAAAPKEVNDDLPWQDENFFFIVGYTDWGFPYGITWEEEKQMNNDASLFATAPPEDIIVD
ncbi:hypothetical protein [Cohnella sp. GbtcB17]|uniref:hypothetical protein n=1 Tax=Cohnella sp. GbtcB17 TaxID=2824762 RepID=UPI001C30F3BC|nr:hypothetical protein [Cohnella sp. GbtcB17]